MSIGQTSVEKYPRRIIPTNRFRFFTKRGNFGSIDIELLTKYVELVKMKLTDLCSLNVDEYLQCSVCPFQLDWQFWKKRAAKSNGSYLSFRHFNYFPTSEREIENGCY